MWTKAYNHVTKKASPVEPECQVVSIPSHGQGDFDGPKRDEGDDNEDGQDEEGSKGEGLIWRVLVDAHG